MNSEKLWAFNDFLKDLDRLNTKIIPSQEMQMEFITRAVCWYEDHEAQKFYRDHFGDVQEKLRTMKPDDPDKKEIEKRYLQLLQFQDCMNHIAKNHRLALREVDLKGQIRKKEIDHVKNR